MESLVDSGKARAIGESPYESKELQLTFSQVCPTSISSKRSVSSKLRGSGRQSTKSSSTRRSMPLLRALAGLTPIASLLPQRDLVDFCKEQGIVVMAHQPLGGKPIGPVKAETTVKPPLELEDIHQIAGRCGLTPAQVCLSWAVERGIPVVPKTVNKDRMRENMNLAKLPRETFEAMDALERKYGATRFLDPSKHIGFDIFDEEKDQPVA